MYINEIHLEFKNNMCIFVILFVFIRKIKCRNRIYRILNDFFFFTKIFLHWESRDDIHNVKTSENMSYQCVKKIHYRY